MIPQIVAAVYARLIDMAGGKPPYLITLSGSLHITLIQRQFHHPAASLRRLKAYLLVSPFHFPEDLDIVGPLVTGCGFIHILYLDLVFDPFNIFGAVVKFF